MSPEQRKGLITTTPDDFEIHYTDHQYYMDFKVYEIVGRGQDPKTQQYDVPLYGNDFHEIATEEDIFWEGFIKWDGCSNWDFKTDNCMAHFCGRNHAASIGRLMDKLYELASAMSRFDKELAK